MNRRVCKKKKKKKERKKERWSLVECLFSLTYEQKSLPKCGLTKRDGPFDGGFICQDIRTEQLIYKYVVLGKRGLLGLRVFL